MGDQAEMILQGIVCQYCGEYIGDPCGQPRTCNDCIRDLAKALNSKRTKKPKPAPANVRPLVRRVARGS